MDLALKLELTKKMNKWLNEICEDNPDDVYFTDKVIDNMVDAAEVVYDQNLETQKWLKEQGYMED